MRLIDIDHIPRRNTRDPNKRLLNVLHNIPKGKALVLTETELEELGVSSVHAVRAAVMRYVKKNLLPETIKPALRVTNGQQTVYVMNLIKCGALNVDNISNQENKKQTPKDQH